MNGLLILLFFLFFSGIGLLLSGIQMDAENKASKSFSIVFGTILIIGTILIGIFIMVYAIAYI